MKPDLIELSHQITDLIGDLHEAGAWREVYEYLGNAYEALLDQINEEGLENEQEE